MKNKRLELLLTGTKEELSDFARPTKDEGILAEAALTRFLWNAAKDMEKIVNQLGPVEELDIFQMFIDEVGSEIDTTEYDQTSWRKMINSVKLNLEALRCMNN